MTSIKLIGVLGGTFDPIHLGHIHLVNSILEQTYVNYIKLVPCNYSPFRSQPFATNNQRLKMLELVTQESSNVSIDTYEIERNGPSYTIKLLQHLQRELLFVKEKCGLCLIIGADAFVHFTSWHKWEEILTLCNIIVADRPGTDQLYKTLPPNFPAQIVDSAIKLHRQTSGLIWFADLQPLNISASAIRYLISQEQYFSARALLHPKVWKYIEKNKIYR